MAPPHARGAQGDSLYGALLLRVATALRHPGSKLRGILWYQGESDTFDDRASRYEADTVNLINQLRTDLRLPDLLVLVIQLGRFVPNREHLLAGHTETAWNIVRESQRRIGETVPRVGLTSAIDLPLCDEIHLNTPGLQRLGRRAGRVASGRPGPRLQHVRRSAAQPNQKPTVTASFANVSGTWNIESAIPGFDITTADGTPHPGCSVLEVAVSPDNPTSLQITLSADSDDIHLRYGAGFDPSARLADGEDDPLPAFGPQPVT